MAFPEAWEETCLVSVSKFNGIGVADTTLELMAITETVDLPQGDYPGESIPNLAGGRVWKQSPEEDGEFTLELYPIDISVASNTGLFQFFNGGDVDSSQPLATDTTWGAGVSRVRDRFRIAVMWTDDTAVTSAESATSVADSVALRFAAMGCRFISHKAEFTDGILKVTATFKYPAMNKIGDTKMWRWESTNDGDTSIMTALPDYDDEDSWTA